MVYQPRRGEQTISIDQFLGERMLHGAKGTFFGPWSHARRRFRLIATSFIRCTSFEGPPCSKGGGIYSDARSHYLAGTGLSMELREKERLSLRFGDGAKARFWGPTSSMSLNCTVLIAGLLLSIDTWPAKEQQMNTFMSRGLICFAVLTFGDNDAM